MHYSTHLFFEILRYHQPLTKWAQDIAQPNTAWGKPVEEKKLQKVGDIGNRFYGTYFFTTLFKASKLLFESFVNISPSKADDMSDLPQSEYLFYIYFSKILKHWTLFICKVHKNSSFKM